MDYTHTMVYILLGIPCDLNLKIIKHQYIHLFYNNII